MGIQYALYFLLLLKQLGMLVWLTFFEGGGGDFGLGVDGEGDDEEGRGFGDAWGIFPNVEGAAAGAVDDFGRGSEAGLGLLDALAFPFLQQRLDAAGPVITAPVDRGFTGEEPEAEDGQRHEEEYDFKYQRRTLFYR